eukprot:3132280-Rhodomonas_salina.2
MHSPSLHPITTPNRSDPSVPVMTTSSLRSNMLPSDITYSSPSDHASGTRFPISDSLPAQRTSTPTHSLHREQKQGTLKQARSRRLTWGSPCPWSRPGGARGGLLEVARLGELLEELVVDREIHVGRDLVAPRRALVGD